MTTPTRRHPRRHPVLPAGPKLQARRRAERRARLRGGARRAGWGALALLPVLLLTWVVLSSPLFDIDRIKVTGTTSPEVVREAAGVASGRPLARVDVAAVQRRVAALASVQEVRVRRDWPGTLRVEVVERAPVAAVASGRGVRLLAPDGTPYATVATRPRGVVPLVVPAPGPSASDRTTQAGLAVLAEVRGPLRARITSVRAEAPQRVLLVMSGRRVVVWGAPGDRVEEKTRTVAALLRRPGGRIDVSNPGVATVTSVPAAAAAP